MKKLTILLALNCVFAMTVMCSSDSKEADPADAHQNTEMSNMDAATSEATNDEPAVTQDDPVASGEVTADEPMAANTPAPTPDLPPNGSGKPVVGKVVDVIALALGGDGMVDKAGAEAAVAKGHPLALLVDAGGKKMVFYVVHSNGQMATDELVNRANYDVAVIGKRVNNGGVSAIVADKIESMR